jgi:hypothetical protein
MLPILGIYQHYKGNFYQVIGISRHSETLEIFVVYQQLYAGFGLWVRPAEMFLETITVDGQNRPRFKFIEEHLVKAPSVS